MKYLFRIPFKADLLHGFLCINRIIIYQFSIQIISNTSQFFSLNNGCSDFGGNFRPAGYGLSFSQKDFLFPVLCRHTALSPQINFCSYLPVICSPICHQDSFCLRLLPVSFIIKIIISKAQQFFCITPFIVFVVRPSAPQKTDDKCPAFLFPGTYIAISPPEKYNLFFRQERPPSCPEVHLYYVQKKFSFR